MRQVSREMSGEIDPKLLQKHKT